MLSQKRLRELLHYDPTTGLFTRLTQIKGAGKIGSIAGYTRKDGYVKIFIDGKYYNASHLAFIYMKGINPKIVDHVNNIRYDNRWINLRECTTRQNAQNTKAIKNTISGKLGVTPSGNLWKAHICDNGYNKYIGRYSTIDEAHAAYLEEKRKIHEFGEL